jgi:hypothetical protein
MGTFMYHVAPVDTVLLEVRLVPLQVKVFVDRVVLAAATEVESESLVWRLSEGSEGVPKSLQQQLTDAFARPGDPLWLSVPYREIRLRNAEIDVALRAAGPGLIDSLAVWFSGDVDLFASFALGETPTWARPGSPVYEAFTRRSQTLERILGIESEGYPPDDQFPPWARKRDAQWFPTIWSNWDERRRQKERRGAK